MNEGYQPGMTYSVRVIKEDSTCLMSSLSEHLYMLHTIEVTKNKY